MHTHLLVNDVYRVVVGLYADLGTFWVSAAEVADGCLVVFGVQKWDIAGASVYTLAAAYATSPC